MSIRLRRIAQREFDDAADWYEQRQAGLGAQFIDEIQRVLDVISQNPQQFAEVHADFRQALANRFPYAIYYKVESSNRRRRDSHVSRSIRLAIARLITHTGFIRRCSAG